MRTPTLRRRELLGAVVLGTTGAGCAGLDGGDDGNASGSDGDSATPTQDGEAPTEAGRTHRVDVGGDDLGFDPEQLLVEPGDTVVWEWLSRRHNVEVTSSPAGAEWRGRPDLADTGTTHEHTFEVEGVYSYVCVSHMDAGTTGEILVYDGDADRSIDVVVGGGDLTFFPGRIEVEQGTTVTWEWADGVHTVDGSSVPSDASWQGHTSDTDAGTVYEHAFDVPGVYEYESRRGAGVTGEVVVTGPDGEMPFDGRIEVGPDGLSRFEPMYVEIEPGTTVRWEWDSDDHNVEPVSVRGASWTGHSRIEDRGHVYEHTFEEPGTYEYESSPYATEGMTGTIVVNEE